MTKRTTERPFRASVQKRATVQGHTFYARLHLRDGSRPAIRLPNATSESAARAEADRLQAKAWAEGWVKEPPTAPGETVARWFGRYFAHREVKGLRGIKQERSKFAAHIEPAFGLRDIASLTRADVEAFVRQLDDSVLARRFSWKTARHVWGILSHGLRQAHRSKRPELRALATDIVAGVEGPDRGAEKQRQFLYPSEFLAVVSCDRVPLRWRRIIALSVYLYPRPGELAALDWRDVDLEHRVVSIHRACDAEGNVHDTKTGDKRLVTIEPALVPLLEKMRDEAGGEGRVVADMPHERLLSDKLRLYLTRAGVKRAALFVPADDPQVKRLRWYDLRATGLTWRAVRGDSPVKIQRGAGHTEPKTTGGYIRQADSLNPAFGEPFPALPVELLSTAPVNDERVGRPRSRKGLDRSGERGIRTRQEQAFSASDPAVKPVSIPPGLPAFPPSALPGDTNVDDNAVEADARARHLLVAIAALLEQARHEDAAQLARRLTALLEQLATVGAALALLTAGLAATGGEHPRMAQDPYVSSGLHGLSPSLTTTSRERSFRPFDSFGRAKTGHRGGEGSPEGSPRSFGVQTPERGGHR